MTDAVFHGEDGVARCWWSAATDQYQRYHDEEWGRPTADERWIFEKMCLEGFQSGLSWRTILEKRKNFRAAFANFEYDAVAQFDDDDFARLMADKGIVRHRGKIAATFNNAARAQEIRAEFGSLAAYVWRYEPPRDTGPGAATKSEHFAIEPAEEAKRLARDLKKRGWKFFGPTTAYAFMQAAGLVNDHAAGCDARAICLELRETFEVPQPK